VLLHPDERYGGPTGRIDHPLEWPEPVGRVERLTREGGHQLQPTYIARTRAGWIVGSSSWLSLAGANATGPVKLGCR
jgi:hypothetical protein